MIDVMTLDTAYRFPGCLESMYRLRHNIFVERLGWDIPTSGGMERDQFDHEDTYYLCLRNQEGDVVASCRFLPTSGPNLLCDVFPELVDGKPARDLRIWEASRLAIDHRKERLVSAGGCRKVAGTLFCGIMEFALAMKLTHMVSVSDERLERLLSLAGWNLKRLGQPLNIGDCIIAGEQTEVSFEALQILRRKAGIRQAVLDASDLSPIRRAA